MHSPEQLRVRHHSLAAELGRSSKQYLNNGLVPYSHFPPIRQ
jgi:hypothetical protein